jgi:hypothetical protein
MDVELERRLARLEKTLETEETIARFERRAVRIGGLLILLITILLILLNKLDDVVVTIARVLGHALGR